MSYRESTNHGYVAQLLSISQWHTWTTLNVNDNRELAIAYRYIDTRSPAVICMPTDRRSHSQDRNHNRSIITYA